MAGTYKAIDNLGRLIWRGCAEGHVTEADAERLSTALEGRRAVIRQRSSPSPLAGESGGERSAP
jgi:hypothetical protein